MDLTSNWGRIEVITILYRSIQLFPNLKKVLLIDWTWSAQFIRFLFIALGVIVGIIIRSRKCSPCPWQLKSFLDAQWSCKEKKPWFCVKLLFTNDIVTWGSQYIWKKWNRLFLKTSNNFDVFLALSVLLDCCKNIVVQKTLLQSHKRCFSQSELYLKIYR